MKLLELYAGSRSIGKVAEKHGFEVFSVDINEFENIDLVIDILNMKPSDVPFVPDVVWASPPCTTFSVAAISHHRDGQKPKTEFAKKSDELVQHTWWLIDEFKKKNPKLVHYMENPRGMLRKMWFQQNRGGVCNSYLLSVWGHANETYRYLDQFYNMDSKACM